MYKIDITADTRSLALLQRLSNRQIKQVTSRAINRTLTVGRTQARNAVKAIYNMPQRYMDRQVNILRSYPNKLEGAVVASAKPVPMDAFDPKFSFSQKSVTTISRRGVMKTKIRSRDARRGMGVVIEVLKGKKEEIPYAFMIPTLKGRVFGRGAYRPGESSGYGFVQRHARKPNDNNNDSVTSMLSVTVHAAAINPKAQLIIFNKVNEYFPSRWIHEAEYLLNK